MKQDETGSASIGFLGTPNGVSEVKLHVNGATVSSCLPRRGLDRRFALNGNSSPVAIESLFSIMQPSEEKRLGNVSRNRGFFLQPEEFGR